MSSYEFLLLGVGITQWSVIRHYISKKNILETWHWHQVRIGYVLMFTWTYSTISAVNSKTLRTFLAIKIGCHFWLVSMKLSRKWNHIESNNHLGIHMVRFCYHNDPRKNDASAREAWSTSHWEGSSHVHFDVTCTSRVLLERIVCKHRYLEKYIASNVFKVALISINIADESWI